MKTAIHIPARILLASSLLFLLSCKKYLDEKPSKTVQVISTLNDMQAILDHGSLTNNHPLVADVGSDDYYATYDDYLTRDIESQEFHIWKADAYYKTEWSRAYGPIYSANLVLDNIDKVAKTNNNTPTWNAIKGSALFYRAFIFHDLAQIYCQPYVASTAANDLGIVLRLNSDFNERSVRSTVQQSYDQIIWVLKEAAALLPLNTDFKTRPNKAASFGLLARVFLTMEDYGNAARYADSCLQLYNKLIDYNTISLSQITSLTPFPVFHEEVILHSISPVPNMVVYTRAKIDASLYQLYEPNDLRKMVLFRPNSDGSHFFMGHYSGGILSGHFTGIATDEIYLIRAESRARLGNIDGALNDLNTLLEKRWLTGTFVPYTSISQEETLKLIVAERRKELLMRCLRWSDLRRLNRDSRFAKTLVRNLNGQIYTLPPNDLRYVLLIDHSIIALNGIQQNPR